MKRLFMLSAMLLFALSVVKAQKETTPRKEIAIQLFARASYIDYDLKETPGLGFRYGKHAVFGGPLLGYNYRWEYPVEGIFFGYAYYPAWHFKRLSGHAIVQYQHEEYNDHYYEFAITAGYGLDFRLFGNLYLDQSFTLGAIGDYAPRHIDFYYYGNHGWDFITTLQFGLHYDFVFNKQSERQ